MRVRKATCGLCKPTKRWKKNNTHLKSVLAQGPFDEEVTGNLVKSYTKMGKNG